MEMRWRQHKKEPSAEVFLKIRALREIIPPNEDLVMTIGRSYIKVPKLQRNYPKVSQL